MGAELAPETAAAHAAQTASITCTTDQCFTRCQTPTSLMTQRLNRVHPRRTSRGEVAEDHADEG
jgi:hypothetical protein